VAKLSVKINTPNTNTLPLYFLAWYRHFSDEVKCQNLYL